MNIDKQIYLQILGSLMKNPLLLEDINDYALTPDDFPNLFEKLIFSSIYNLSHSGFEKLSVFDIDNYLKENGGRHKIFEDNNGIKYLQDAMSIAEEDNFKYYYTKLKKYNSLRDLKNLGIDTSAIYPEDDLDPKALEKLEAFEKMKVEDIFDKVRGKITTVEAKYTKTNTADNVTAAEGIEDLLENLKVAPLVGKNCQGKIFNTVTRGAVKGCFYIRSAASGVGKTRSLLGDACYLAFPFRYNLMTGQWDITGNSEKVLFVATEQSVAEIQTMVLAYISGINEEKILYGNFNDNEMTIIKKSIKVMKYFQDNLRIIQIPDPDTQKIKTTIKRCCLTEGREYVFFDYIFSSPGLLAEFKGLDVREDVILGFESLVLKDLAVELKIFLMSGTQVNENVDKKKGIKDQTCIRGSKAIADKVDMGCITMRPSRDDLNLLGDICNKIGKYPNQVTDVYKLRRGRYTEVRIWSYFDLGTCRKEDLFITRDDLKEVEGFEVNNNIYFDGKDYAGIISEINGEEPKKEEKVFNESEGAFF